MFHRTRKLIGKVLGGTLYWIGWGVAVVVLVQAIILSVTTGNPLIPVMLGVIGVVVWLVAVAIKYVVAGRQLPP